MCEGSVWALPSWFSRVSIRSLYCAQDLEFRSVLYLTTCKTKQPGGRPWRLREAATPRIPASATERRGREGREKRPDYQPCGEDGGDLPGLAEAGPPRTLARVVGSLSMPKGFD